MADDTVYVVADGVTLYATDEKIFTAGEVVTVEDFESAAEFKGLKKAGKIVPQSPSPEPTPEGDWDTFSIDSALDSTSPNPVKNSTLTPIIEDLEEADTTLQGLITDERTNRQYEDEALQGLITDERTSRQYEDEVLQGNIDAVTELIPAQASSSNQLADKDFVNSSISTNTAHYISNNGEPFTSVSDLPTDASVVTDNDYAFVTGTDESGNTYYDRYKATVSDETVSWGKEYRLNNSSFTAEQWAAISSGITGTAVAQIESNRQAIAGKQDALAFDDVPMAGSNNVAKSGGIFQASSVIMASSKVITGAAISAGSPVRVMFTAAIAGVDTTTGLSLTYNEVSYAVKVGKQGSLVDFVAHEVSDGVYKYLQAYTTLEMVFDGTQFVIIGNPVVLSSSDYTIYADGFIKQFYFNKTVTNYSTYEFVVPYKSYAIGSLSARDSFGTVIIIGQVYANTDLSSFTVGLAQFGDITEAVSNRGCDIIFCGY